MTYDLDEMNNDDPYVISSYDDLIEYERNLYRKNRHKRHKEAPKKRKFINSNWDDRHPIIKALYILNDFLWDQYNKNAVLKN